MEMVSEYFYCLDAYRLLAWSCMEFYCMGIVFWHSAGDRKEMVFGEATKDKMILITRYPIDSYYNQFCTKIKVASTLVTEPMIVNDKFIKNFTNDFKIR